MDFEKIGPDNPRFHPHWRRNHYSCRGSSFYQMMGDPQRAKPGIVDSPSRLAVGMEARDDLIADIGQALI